MTDNKLKQALAKMLPHVVIFGAFRGYADLHWKSEQIEHTPVIDTELLHLCALVEETLTDDEDQKYRDEIFRSINDTKWSKLERIMMRSTWQQRATALAKVKGIKV